jgi:[acyl-carrier-protein] S-malonyltransferase
MLAVLGHDRPTVEAVARDHGLTVANDNAPEQLVLSGPAAALEAAGSVLRRRGLRSHRLPVGGAFHSPAMTPAVAPFRAALERVELCPPDVPVLSCATAEPFGADVRERLADALVRPVRWLELLRALHARGVTRFLEAGPGRVLTGLVRRSLPGVRAEAPLERAPARGRRGDDGAAAEAPLEAGAARG